MADLDELRRLLERLDEVDPVPWVVLENGKIGTPDTPANTDTNREDEVNELRKQFTVAMRNSAGQLLDAADEVFHLRSRVRGLEADLRLERAELKALEHTLVNELTRSPCWPYDSAPDEPCSRINYLQHLRYLKARAARVEELEAKLADERLRAAEWLRGQEE